MDTLLGQAGDGQVDLLRSAKLDGVAAGELRLENELVCKKLTDNEYGTFLDFEILTMIPFNMDAVLPEEMSEVDM